MRKLLLILAATSALTAGLTLSYDNQERQNIETVCDQAELDRESQSIGAYEIQCEELNEGKSNE